MFHAVTRTDIKEVLTTEFRFLCFRPVKPNLERHSDLYLLLGVSAAWLVGIGRYWDNPKAESWQLMGMGSVIYIVVLALLLWVLLAPLRPRNWTYRNVLIFVGMTSPPGLVYAIPVERWSSLETAQSVNAGFLAAVSAWRVALMVLYLKRSSGLGPFTLLVATLLPLALIVVTLSQLNLEHAVFNIMGGITQNQAGPNDVAYEAIVAIGLCSFVALPFLLLAYIALIFARRRQAV